MNFGFQGWPAPRPTGIGTNYAKGITPTSNIGYSNIAQITDGSVSTSGGASSVNTPQYVQVDLGVPRPILRSRMIFTDSAHRSATGSLLASNDATNWVTVATWTADGSVSRTLDLGVQVYRHWRLNTTTTGSPGGSGVDIYEWELLG